MDTPGDIDAAGAIADLVAHLRVDPRDSESGLAVAPDWFGPRVFGGMVIGQALWAATNSVREVRPHSLHATFLGAVQPGEVEWRGTTLRDGRTFATRQVSAWQEGREACRAVVSFHRDEAGDDYQLPMPDVPAPHEAPVGDGPPVWEVRDLGPTPPRPDGYYDSTLRHWRRAVHAVPDDPVVHLAMACFLSDFTHTSFRPLTSREWGTHTDASIDHAVWFHRRFRVDEWIYCAFHALVNHGARATLRGEFWSGGLLCMSMAQELLIRPLEP